MLPVEVRLSKQVVRKLNAPQEAPLQASEQEKNEILDKMRAQKSFTDDDKTPVRIYCLYAAIWVFIVSWIWSMYNSMTYIGKREMFASLSCTIQHKSDLVCKVHMQNTVPTLVEKCGKYESHFCGPLRMLCPHCR